MTVRENIAYGLKAKSREQRDTRVGDMIRLFRLEGLENTPPSEISGGQKQRVALARALIERLRALLLDEPFTALVRAKILKKDEHLHRLILEVDGLQFSISADSRRSPFQVGMEVDLYVRPDEIMIIREGKPVKESLNTIYLAAKSLTLSIEATIVLSTSKPWKEGSFLRSPPQLCFSES